MQHLAANYALWNLAKSSVGVVVLCWGEQWVAWCCSPRYHNNLDRLFSRSIAAMHLLFLYGVELRDTSSSFSSLKMPGCTSVASTSHHLLITIFHKLRMKRIEQDSYYAHKSSDGSYYAFEHYENIDLEKECSEGVVYFIERNDIYREAYRAGIPYERDGDVRITQRTFEDWDNAVKKMRLEIIEFCRQNSRTCGDNLKEGDYIFQEYPAEESPFHRYGAECYISKVISVNGDKYTAVTEVFNNDVTLSHCEGYDEKDEVTAANGIKRIDADIVATVKKKIETLSLRLMQEIEDELYLTEIYYTKDQLLEYTEGYKYVILIDGIMSDYSIEDLPNGEFTLNASGLFEREFWEDVFPFANLNDVIAEGINEIYIINLPKTYRRRL